MSAEPVRYRDFVESGTRSGKIPDHWWDVSCPGTGCPHAGMVWRVLAPRGENYACARCGTGMRVVEVAG